jgi:hypothetical protein
VRVNELQSVWALDRERRAWPPDRQCVPAPTLGDCCACSYTSRNSEHQRGGVAMVDEAASRITERSPGRRITIVIPVR